MANIPSAFPSQFSPLPTSAPFPGFNAKLPKGFSQKGFTSGVNSMRSVTIASGVKGNILALLTAPRSLIVAMNDITGIGFVIINLSNFL